MAKIKGKEHCKSGLGLGGALGEEQHSGERDNQQLPGSPVHTTLTVNIEKVIRKHNLCLKTRPTLLLSGVRKYFRNVKTMKLQLLLNISSFWFECDQTVSL